MWEWRKKSEGREKRSKQQKTSLACLLDFEAVVNCSKCETHTITLLHSVYLNELKRSRRRRRKRKPHSRPMPMETKWSTHKREEEDERKNEQNNTKETTIWLFGCAPRIWNSWMHDCQALGSTVQCVTVGRWFFSLALSLSVLCCCARDLIHTIFFLFIFHMNIRFVCFFSSLLYSVLCIW